MADPVHIALLYGSNREGRICDKVADWAASRVEAADGFTLERIDPLELTLPVRHGGEPSGDVKVLKETLERADAFLVVTPEYNHSFPAILKAVIDQGKDEWQAKPVAFVSYGGIAGGLRAVEHLRLVFAELHAVTVRDVVSFAGVWNRFGDDGKLKDPEREEKTMTTVLQRLDWWARSLRRARGERPYNENK